MVRDGTIPKPGNKAAQDALNSPPVKHGQNGMEDGLFSAFAEKNKQGSLPVQQCTA